MNKNILLLVSSMTFCCQMLCAQHIKSEERESETELKHYVPLYLDIPAELNVKKGYQEINVAGGYGFFRDNNAVRGLIEYDFAPIDKLGFEIEIPFIFLPNQHDSPGDYLEEVMLTEEGGALESAASLRLGFTYTLFSLPAAKTTLGVGYNNELETLPFAEFNDESGHRLFIANVYNPFITVAKIWGERFHSMIYTGPAIKQEFDIHKSKTQYRFNTILSYRFGRGNKESFVGLECNQSFGKHMIAQMVLRPQVQLDLSYRWKIGIITGIPIETYNYMKGGGFLRLIYSPGSVK